MKSLITIAILALSIQGIAAETIQCNAQKAIQYGAGNLKADAELTFQLERNGTESVIENVNGHVFVQSQFEDGNVINSDNSYMGYFKINSIKANANYNPLKFKDWFQFKDFNAAKTEGLEDGMWGTLVIDLSRDDVFEARYIFQAGDHMGGTVLFTCRAND